MLGEVHGAMTNVDEGDEHQMERRLYGRRRLEKVHCDAKRKHKATLPELAKLSIFGLKNLQIILR